MCVFLFSPNFFIQENIGPVTMAVLGINSLLFFYQLDLPFSTADADVCIGAGKVWFGGQFRRLLLHAFFHGSSMHLYYNMTSLLLKGRLLENVIGTWPFAWLIFSFTLTTGAVLTAMSILLDPLFPQYAFPHTCAIGFSGVLFALNTILPFVLVQPEQSDLYGFRIPTRYVTLAELGLISLLVPNASFMGHLAGILVGFMYITRKFHFWFHMPELLLAPDPLVPRRNGAADQPGAGRGQFFVDARGNLRRQ